MSHFSKIQTNINNIDLLKKTLIDLGFNCYESVKSIKDANGRFHSVNLIAKDSAQKANDVLVGFAWQNDHYDIIVDLDFWQKKSTFDFFVEQLYQNYALNTILEQTKLEGFQKIYQDNLLDGSMKVTVQRWI